MTAKEAIEIIERLKDTYSKTECGGDIVTALNFAIDSLVIVRDAIEEGWEDEDHENLS